MLALANKGQKLEPLRLGKAGAFQKVLLPQIGEVLGQGLLAQRIAAAAAITLGLTLINQAEQYGLTGPAGGFDPTGAEAGPLPSNSAAKTGPAGLFRCRLITLDLGLLLRQIGLRLGDIEILFRD